MSVHSGSSLEFARACARAHLPSLLGRKSEKWPLAASNDLKSINEYSYGLNDENLERVCEVKILAKSSHFGGKTGQTDNNRSYIGTYIDAQHTSKPFPASIKVSTPFWYQ